MKNISPVWGFCECGNDLHRSVKDASYTVTWPGTVFCFVRHDVLTQVLKIMPGGLMKGNWTLDRAKRPRWHKCSPTLQWEFHHHQLLSRSVGQETTNQRCVKSQKSADLIYTTFEAWNHATVEVLCFLLLAYQDNAQTEVGRVFSLLCCSHVCWSFYI